MILSVGDLLVAEHGRDGIVAHVQTDAQSSAEKLDGQMLAVTGVQNDAVLLARGEGECDIGSRPRAERIEGQESAFVETDARQTIASLPSEAGRAFANVVGGATRLEADSVLAVVLLARTRLRVEHLGHR